jgi:3-dehydroquinate dehydratase-1
MDFEAFVLAAATADLHDEPAARQQADAVEFRMDLAADPLEQLDGYGGELPLLVTNRVQWEGGEASDDDRRIDRLESALEYPDVEAVDIELDAVRNGEGERIVETARDLDVQVVISVHDFDRTPDPDRLRSLLAAAAAPGDVGKLAVTAVTTDDVLDLFRVTWQLTCRGASVATMAMGETGRHSRVVAPLYGSRIGYAPVDPADATAPGQYDLATLSELLDAFDPEETRSEYPDAPDTTF